MVGHTKDYCRQDDHRQDIRFVQTKCFFGIFQEHDLHAMKDFHYNMKNEQACACAICEVKSHSTTECQLNLKTDRTIKQSIKRMLSHKITPLTIMKGIKITIGMIEIIIKGMMAIDMGDETTTIN